MSRDQNYRRKTKKSAKKKTVAKYGKVSSKGIRLKESGLEHYCRSKQNPKNPKSNAP